MPSVLTIETGAVCPLSCVFCPQTNPAFDLSRGFLLLGDFKRIVDLFEGSLDHINLFNWGEPLLNPELPLMIRYASERKIYTVVHSNLNFLTPALAEALISSGLSRLSASIDGASEGSYAKYRVRGSFKKALENLRMLILTKKKLGLDTPELVWQFLVFRHNEHELSMAKKIADDLGVAIQFKFAVVFKKGFESSLPDYDGRGFLKKFIRDYDSPCEALWKNPIVHSDGTVFPCCQIFEKKYAVGNLLKEKFDIMWNSAKYQELRNIVAGRIQADESSFCSQCVFHPVAGEARYQTLRAVAEE